MTKITVQATINSPIDKIWKMYTDPKHIIQWNNASDDWHTPNAKNDLRVGGRFFFRMEARDGSAGFDFEGEYTEVEKHKSIIYIMDDGREVRATFEKHGEEVLIKIIFDAENENPLEMQKEGWQSILDNFKDYVENF